MSQHPSDSPVDAFRPGPKSIEWIRVSPRYFRLRLLQRTGWALVCSGAVALVAVLNSRWNWGWPAWLMWGFFGLVVAWQALFCVLTARQVRSWGYAEFPEHLVITRGVLVRRVTSVPYGRMQLVDVRSGMLETLLGLASVELQTASASTNALIRGVTQQEADRLREVLTLRGQEQMRAL